MGHTIRDKKKLLDRVSRLRGQVDGIQRALEEEQDCFAILQNISACRGALNGLMAEVIEGHVMLHVLDHHRKPTDEQARAAELLLNVIRTYLK